MKTLLYLCADMVDFSCRIIYKKDTRRTRKCRLRIRKSSSRWNNIGWVSLMIINFRQYICQGLFPPSTPFLTKLKHFYYLKKDKKNSNSNKRNNGPCIAVIAIKNSITVFDRISNFTCNVSVNVAKRCNVPVRSLSFSGKVVKEPLPGRKGLILMTVECNVSKG